MESLFQLLRYSIQHSLQLAILAGVVIVPQVSLSAPSPTRASVAATVKPDRSLCPAPALSRLARHRIAAGETLESIASRYNLIPATLMGLNPSLRSGNAPVGAEILIPPFNGVRVEVPAGKTWRDVAKSYNVRADALFEANGCQQSPQVVYVPGVNWSPVPTATPATSSRTNSPLRYPLPAIASVLTNYGWQLDPVTGKLVFNSGVDLSATAGTSVLAVGEGTVAFAGAQAGYGNLIVVNHPQGLQTRYAQLATIAVRTGQQVRSGTRLGTVGVSRSGSQPFLHFEVRSNSNLGWVAQDPANYIPNLKTADQVRNRGLGGGY
jgi:murein DD-endopeptidase MepM/ murein hydrolase activator NlpD